MNATDPRETADLIASDKVEGTNVYRSNGETLGEIERVMIGKRSGRVAYAVMSFGGFLGIGEDYYPIPWSRLSYNDPLGGYEVNIDEEELRDAPKFGRRAEWEWNDQHMSELNTYYGVRSIDL
jgi:sporulation protein YlmC with PRC-barrel domain